MIKRKAAWVCFMTLPLFFPHYASAWFFDAFDTYAAGTCSGPDFCPCTPDQVAFDTAWPAGPGTSNEGPEQAFESGTCPGGRFIGTNKPFSWKMRKGQPVLATRSLIPSIQAASDPSKNAVNGTDENPIVITFQFWGPTGGGKQNASAAWLQLFSGPSPVMDAPITIPGAGVCTSGFCVGGALDGAACSSDDVCNEMKLVRSGPNSACAVANHTPAVPRPAFAYGMFGGTTGLIPKTQQTCTNFVNYEVSNPVIFDGSEWWQMASTTPPGSTGDNFLIGQRLNYYTITIKTSTIDVLAEFIQPTSTEASCNVASNGTCANNDGTCDLGTNTCTGGVHAGQACTDDLACHDVHTCVGGAKAGAACNVSSPDCSATVCSGGINKDQICTANSGCRPVFTFNKTGIPRQYTGPFQTIAVGPGAVRAMNPDGTFNNGSDFALNFDNITINGGVFTTEPTGGCCQPASGTCIEGVIEDACVQQGGVYVGDNTTCAQSTCITGACCLQTGVCLETDPADCASQNGSFSGANTHCTDPNVTCCPHGSYAWADSNADGFVDMNDFAAFQRCWTGPTGSAVPAGCKCFNRVASTPSRIDQDDLDKFTNCFGRTGIPANPSCGQ